MVYGAGAKRKPARAAPPPHRCHIEADDNGKTEKTAAGGHDGGEGDADAAEAAG